MARYITLNPGNASYFADYFASIIQQASSGDKILGDLYKMPEFASAMRGSISAYFLQNADQNVKIDLNKLSDINIDTENETEKTYADDSLMSEEDEESYKEILASVSGKNIRVAFLPIVARIIAAVGPRLMGILTKYFGPAFSAAMPFLSNLGNWLTEQLNKLKDVIGNFINQFADPDFYKELVLSYNAYDAINEAKRNEMYSVGAYTHMLENDKARGYGGQLHSQGAYEVFGPELKKQIADQIVKNPDIVKSRFSNDPNLAPVIKNNIGQLVSSSNKKFIKVAQQQMSEGSQAKLQELKGLVPNWDVKDVLKEVHSIYQSPDIPQEQKQQIVDSTLAKYLRAAQPLYAFLKDNNFPTPDTAQ